ncbi:MAG: GNAT family N-acetyltransferase [Lachnospiraceae bacterium]|nr:GNAT family N-acetyltransferase [Lachnospiraceae bacterium]
MSKSQYIEQIIAGHELYWDMLGNLRGNENHKGNLSWLSGDINYIYKVKLNGPDYNADVSNVIAKLDNHEIPLNLIITPDTAPADVDVCELFLAYDQIEYARTNSGMAKEIRANGNSTYMNAYNNDIKVFKVSKPSHLKMCGVIFNAVFEYDIFSLKHYIDAFCHPNVYFYMAEHRGVPAGACMAIHGNDFVQIAWVGTLKGYRQRGIAGYLIGMAEKAALIKGIELSVLSAYPEGLNAYKRIGYKQYCEIVTLDYKGE